ncbi:MAG: hypothetical protein MUQ27_09525, partial [Acidimicrobiia bacterium]|nr:hypothetical protein [Acidimicrobiia bacterium]
VIVVGQVGRVLDVQTDYGSESDNNGPGNRVALREFKVSEVLRGTADDTIIIAGPDTATISSHETSPISEGDQLVLFLVEETAEEAPGISGFDRWYTPLSLDNGVFDVTNNVATPRMPDAFATAAAPSPTYDIEHLRSLVADR